MRASSILQKFRDLLLENFNLIVCLLILALAGTLAYRNAFGTPFIFDDLTQIIQNTQIQSFDWPWEFLRNNRRPFLYTTLAFNFHYDGFNSFGFHAFNIRVHILAAMILFLLVRKTLLLPALSSFVKRDAQLLALGAALLWLLHPVQTQAVTYIIQRAESLMGLLFLSALYFSSLYMTSRRVVWLVAAGLASMLAGLTKEVTLVLPLMVLFYDRTFISKSSRKALNKNRWLYAALSLTWIVMGVLFLTTKPEEHLTAGFGMKDMSPLLYAVNQPAVILHYLRLTIWPDPLIFDYQWPAVPFNWSLFPSIWLIGSWVMVLVIAYRKFPSLSFLGMSFFILLLPSSSIIPLQDLIFEYRVYLSLACETILFILLLKWCSERWVQPKSQFAFLTTILALMSLVFGGLTFQRNQTYASEEKIWLDVINKQPKNARAYNNIGEFWLRKGRYEDAKQSFLTSLSLKADYADVYSNMASVLGKEGKIDEAIKYAQKAVELNPDFPVGYNNLGSALSQAGRFKEAAPYFKKTLEMGFIREGIFMNLAVALINSGEAQKAVTVLKHGLKFYPDSQILRSTLDEIMHSNKKN